MTDERKAVLIKNLAELKRVIQPGMEFVCISHAYHPGIVGLVREVTLVQTVGFYSKIKDQPNHKYSDCNYGKGFFTPFGKASEYIFDGDNITVLNSRLKDGSALFTFRLFEQEQIQTNEREEKTMNPYEAERRIVQRVKDTYPPGTRIMLNAMNDPYAPVEPGTRGTVKYVDDMGQIGMKWDNGRTLALIPGEDSFRILNDRELTEERMSKLPRISGELVALTSDDEETFMGYTTGRKWNGWECPLFPKDSADKIMAHINGEGGQMIYDAETDSYTVKYISDGESETFKGEDYLVNGEAEHLYAIGSHSWIWDRAQDMDEDDAPVMGM